MARSRSRGRAAEALLLVIGAILATLVMVAAVITISGALLAWLVPDAAGERWTGKVILMAGFAGGWASPPLWKLCLRRLVGLANLAVSSGKDIGS